MKVKSTKWNWLSCIAALCLLSGCNGRSGSTPTSTDETPATSPTAVTKNAELHYWEVSKPEVNPIDGVKTQFVSTVSTGNGVDLILCYHNGKLCGGDHAPVFVTAPCWIETNHQPGSMYRKIRLRFDDEKPRTEDWAITDSHKGLTPPHAQSFVLELEKHKSLLLEFGCDRSDPGTVMTLHIPGLRETLDSSGLASRAAFDEITARAKAAAEEKRAHEKAADAALRARVIQYVHQCEDQEAFRGKWCWSDPTGVGGRARDRGFKDTQDEALDDAVELARLGVAFKNK